MSGVRFVFHAGLEEYVAAPVNSMLSRAVAMVEDDAHVLVPVDTGALDASIRSEIVDGHGYVTAGTDHALAVEMGTSNMPAQPFLRPALYQKRSL